MNATFKILYFYDYHHFDTGSPKAMVSVIDSLDLNKFSPLFLASGEGDLVNEMTKRNITIIPGGAESISFKNPFKSLFNIYAQITMLREHKIDILHINEFGWNTDLVFSAWLCNIPVVLHIHNPIEIHSNNINRFFAKKVLVCSETLRRSITNIKYITHKCEVLYNQVDIDWASSGNPIRKQLGIDEKDVVIGTIAQICHRKGSDIFVEVAKRCLTTHDNLTFLLIGPDGSGEVDFANKLREISSQAEYKGRIKFIGSRSDIPNLLASMDIFMLPTRSEPFGIVIIEAMAAGLPVIASKTGGIPEIITNNTIGRTVNKIETDAFYNELQNILNMPDIRNSIGKKGKSSILGRFDTKTISVTINKIYSNLIKAS